MFMQYYNYLKLFFVDCMKPKIEFNEVNKDSIQMSMQLQKHDLFEMAMVDVGQNVKQQFMDFLDVWVKKALGKIISCKIKRTYFITVKSQIVPAGTIHF